MNGAAVVIGSVHMDLIATAARLPRHGESVTGGAFAMAPGGKGGNQAIQLARCGVETSLISRVGDDDFGRTLRTALARKTVRVEQVAVDPERATGASVVLAAEGDYASIIAPGAAGAMSQDDLAAAHHEIERASLAVLQLELDWAFVAQAIDFCAALGTPVMLNASPAPSSPRHLASLAPGAVRWLVVNQVEAAALIGRPVRGLPDAIDAAGRLRTEFGVAEAIVTAGGEGAVWRSAGETITQPAFPATVVDTVGAGDAFLGALAAGVIHGLGRAESLRRACVAGAIAVRCSGAYDAFPTADQIDEYLAGQR
jgi:ribokinase